MKTYLALLSFAFLISCGNNKNDKKEQEAGTEKTIDNSDKKTESFVNAGAGEVSYTVNGKPYSEKGNVLVQKDKDNVSPGNNLLAIITVSGPGGESFVLNFAFTLKPGTYPVVGQSYSTEKEVYGGILGGRPKMTNYKVNLTDCKNLGSNNMGGNRWSLSGNVEGETIINAMGAMKFDKSHPENITISNISFSNLTFDDNFDQLLEEGLKQYNKK